MKLVANWKQLLKKAWSVRLIILAGVLSGAEALMMFIAPAAPRWFAPIIFGVTMSALVARLIAQRSLHEDTDE